MNARRIGVLISCVVAGAVVAGGSGVFASSSAATDDSQQVGHRNIPPEAGPNRPENVPEGYVITPFGYFDPSCVQSLAKGERLLADGRVQHADGSAEAYVAVCDFPHYTSRGVEVQASRASTNSPAVNGGQTETSPDISGWLESANILSSSSTKSFGGLLAIWMVPSNPRGQDDQVLFFFPGFEDINDTQSILQPVLQLNQGQWSIASWNCCLNGITTSSPAVSVHSGDEIYGSITNNCPAGTYACSAWNVLSLDLSTGESTTLSNTPSDGQSFNWAFGGVLEVYYVSRCEDYPPDRELTFDGIIVFDENLHPVKNPPWAGNFDSTSTPQCRYGVKSGPQRVTLNF
jgi:hypothetical protein